MRESKKLRNLTLRRVATTTTLMLALAMASAVIASSRQAQAQTLNVIHNFTGPEGANPEAGVSIRGGNLFGTTYNGANGGGSVYEVVHVGNNWGTTPIYLFASNAHPLSQSRLRHGWSPLRDSLGWQH